MTAQAGLSSINCTSCGAGLSVLGGGRVLAHVCGYCGAVLDTQDNYRVLDSIGKRNHPASPVQIGMTLTVEGVSFTVIGTLGLVETHAGRIWRWVEHQIYSPTHGYLWLNVEDGNLTVSRKVRDFAMSEWLSPSQVESAEQPPRRQHGGASYRYYETSVARIDFMEGEFNWLPKLGETIEVVSLLGPDAMLGLVQSGTEREVELTRLLPRAETARAMGFDPGALGLASRHPLEPYVPLRDEAFLLRVAACLSGAAAVLGLVFLLIPGRTVLDAPAVPLSGLPESYEFELGNTAQIAQVEFRTDFDNQWAALSAEILGPDGQPVIAGERAVSHYSGRDSEGSWTEGSRRASFRFRPAEAGAHRVRLELSDPGSGGSFGTVALRIVQGKPTGFWLFALAIVAAIGVVALTARRALHGKRRFAGSDWTDED